MGAETMSLTGHSLGGYLSIGESPPPFFLPLASLETDHLHLLTPQPTPLSTLSE